MRRLDKSCWTCASLIESSQDPLAAIIEDDHPCSDEFYAATGDPAELDFFDNDGEAKSIVKGRGNPMVFLRDIPR